jgi:2-dehydropantoate 2-reductase
LAHPVRPRSEIWLKLWGNIVFNPVSALSHTTLAGICAFEPAGILAAAMMEEARVVTEKLGLRYSVTIDRRIAGVAAVGEHKTSMLQDVEAGRSLELTGHGGISGRISRTRRGAYAAHRCDL